MNVTSAHNALDRNPLVIDRMAVDLTLALDSAGAGLRGLRSRPLITRLLHGLTGQGQDLVAAVGEDLLASQRATVKALRLIMSEAGRTQGCVLQVAEGLDRAWRRLDRLDAADRALASALDGLESELREDLQELQSQVSTLRADLETEASLRRLHAHYLAGELHPGMGSILGGAMYTALCVAHVAGDPRRQRREFEAAAATVRSTLGTATGNTRDLFLEEAHAWDAQALDRVRYVTESPRAPALEILRVLAERRSVGLPLDHRAAKEQLVIARELHCSGGALRFRHSDPSTLALHLAQELRGAER